jgi:hypothetical protein
MIAVATILGTVASVLGLWVGLQAQQRHNERVLAHRRGRERALQAPLDVPQLWAFFDRHRGELTRSQLRALTANPQAQAFILRYGPRLTSTELGILADTPEFWIDATVYFESVDRTYLEAGASVPAWSLRLLNPEDAWRYKMEWSAHLYQLLEEGEERQARIDRRRLALLAVALAVALRARRIFSGAR